MLYLGREEAAFTEQVEHRYINKVHVSCDMYKQELCTFAEEVDEPAKFPCNFRRPYDERFFSP